MTQVTPKKSTRSPRAHSIFTFDKIVHTRTTFFLSEKVFGLSFSLWLYSDYFVQIQRLESESLDEASIGINLSRQAYSLALPSFRWWADSSLLRLWSTYTAHFIRLSNRFRLFCLCLDSCTGISGECGNRCRC